MQAARLGPRFLIGDAHALAGACTEGITAVAADRTVEIKIGISTDVPQRHKAHAEQGWKMRSLLSNTPVPKARLIEKLLISWAEKNYPGRVANEVGGGGGDLDDNKPATVYVLSRARKPTVAEAMRQRAFWRAFYDEITRLTRQ